MSTLETIEGAAGSALKVGAGMVTHWQAIAFASLALIAGLGAGALHFYDKGFTAASVADAKGLAEANARAAAADADKQVAIDKLAASSAPAIKAKVDSIAAQINALSVKAKAPPKVFADNCVMPASEVAGYNSIK
jgi:hypothetical protein